MTSSANGYAHENNITQATQVLRSGLRFADIPTAIDIPVSGADAEEAVELSLKDLLDDPTELCSLLESENAAKNLWMVIALAYAKQQRIDTAIQIINQGIQSLSRGGPKEKTGLLSLLCWLYLYKSRDAPRVIPDGQLVSEAKTKDYYLQAATGTLNEASRVNPSFPPLFLARGILSLLRASLQPPSKTAMSGIIEQGERTETLRQALKCFDDASRVSAGRNMMALLGKARTLFSLGRYTDALECYQEVLIKMPDLEDPDPRIGIGCCLWQLSYREEAQEAWDRALELNPNSAIANSLMGLYFLYDSLKYPSTGAEFAMIYKKAMTVFIQKAFRINNKHPMTCANFGSYFLPRKAWSTIDTLARKAIEFTDVNAVASDGWYLLARKEHHQQPPELQKAFDYYNRADNARGGGDRGFPPAKFGAAQIQILNGNSDDAKFRVEKIIQHTKALEAMVVLGTMYAHEVFASQGSADKSAERKKAISYLEAARLAWKDPKKNVAADTTLLINLSRLYENDQPERSLQCLLEVQQVLVTEPPGEKGSDEAPVDERRPEVVEDESTRAKKRERLPPQLLSNIGCFEYQVEKYEDAKVTFQAALNACVKLSDKDKQLDTDPLVTSISYNLARAYEASGSLEEAKQVYEGLLTRHPDYTDAQMRLAYIALRQDPTDEGPKAMASLYQSNSANMEVRSLYGWFLSKAKRRAANIAEDQEQRHFKHTLQHYDKHDQYALTGMGNLYLTTAREMRRDSEQDKEKRRKTYEKAIEFYQKALQLDPKNAYAAQGIGIALADDKKDFPSAVQIFSKVKDTVRDASVYINLGHVYGELKQFSRAIESYEAALAKDRASDPQILACLGKVWLLKGKHDKEPSAMKKALEYSYLALEIAPEQIHFKFNVAFVQIQLAQLIYTLPENLRKLADVEDAAVGLDEAIYSFGEIAKSKNPPYPKHDIEQRANMGRNTMRRQLERAVQQQRQYEEANASKYAEARELRETELRRKAEEKQVAEEVEFQRKKALAEERHRMLEVSRVLAEKRAEEEKLKEEAEWTENSDGERVKRKKKPKGGKRKKKGEDDSDNGGELSGEEGGSGRKKPRAKSTSGDDSAVNDEEKPAPKKKRKLARKTGGRADSKIMKSSELVIDSDSDGLNGEAGADRNVTSPQHDTGSAFNVDDEDRDPDIEMADADADAEEHDDHAVPSRRKKVARRITDDDEDEDEDGDDA